MGEFRTLTALMGPSPGNAQSLFIFLLALPKYSVLYAVFAWFEEDKTLT